jgi:DNA polymerase III epsilon subunit-like protein
LTRPRLTDIETRLWDTFTNCPWDTRDKRIAHAVETLIARGLTRADAIEDAEATYTLWDASQRQRMRLE